MKSKINKQIQQAVKDFDAFPEWKKKFYNEMKES